LKTGDSCSESEIGLLEVEPKHLALKLVAIELIRRDVREVPNVRLAVFLEAAVLTSLRLPIKAEVVLHEVFAKQVLFKIQDLRKVVSRKLYGRLTILLQRHREFGPLLKQENGLLGVE
jgi:hypothetical protein